MSNWDDEDFEPTEAVPVTKTEWDDEDADDKNVKDNWDDEDEQKQTDSSSATKEATTTTAPKKKKSLKERIAEKEKQQMERRKAAQEAARELTPEETVTKKLQDQQAVEDADMENIQDTFGVIDKNNIYNMQPETTEQFLEFAQAIVERLTIYEKSPHYPTVLEHVYRNCCVEVDPDEIKKLASSLNAVASEKLKIQKAKTKKGKKKGGVSKEANTLYEDTVYDEYDDFM